MRIAILSLVAAMSLAVLMVSAEPPPVTPPPTSPKPPEVKKDAPAGAAGDSKQVGGESSSTVQVANLIYAGTKTSKCFADHFLVEAEKSSSISTSRRFHAVKLSSDELFEF